MIPICPQWWKSGRLWDCESICKPDRTIYNSDLLLHWLSIFFSIQQPFGVLIAAICSMHYLLKNQYDQKEGQQKPFLCSIRTLRAGRGKFTTQFYRLWNLFNPHPKLKEGWGAWAKKGSLAQDKAKLSIHFLFIFSNADVMIVPPNKLSDPILGKKAKWPIHTIRVSLIGSPRMLLNAQI